MLTEGGAMSANPRKRHCLVDAYGTWTSHGPLVPLLLALEARHDGPRDDVEVINEELEKLREGRAYFQQWVNEFRQQVPADRRGLSPWAFLRAWNDSTYRILQLLRERRALIGEEGGEFDGLIKSVYEELEETLALGHLEAESGPGPEESEGEARETCAGREIPRPSASE